MTPLLLAALLLSQRPDTLRFTILMAGNPSGSELAVRNADGSLYFFEEYNDRGRGPRLETRATLTPSGTLQTLSITGNDYWKQPVDERFTLRGDTAEWSSSLEHDRRRITAPALYSPFYGPVAGMALFIGAAGTSGEVALLPSGRARVAKVGERTVTAGGQSARITHYQIQGLGFTPTDFWVDTDNRLFAFVAGAWFRVLRPGWESIGDALAAAQDSLEKQPMRASRARLPIIPAVQSCSATRLSSMRRTRGSCAIRPSSSAAIRSNHSAPTTRCACLQAPA